MTSPSSRRQFLISSLTGLSSTWIALRWPAILAAQQHAHEIASSTQPPHLQFFSPAQATEVDAMCAQIIPTDDTPGAREAHTVYFIDHALATFDKDKQNAYTRGLPDLEAKTRQMFPGASQFSQLNSAQQIQLLTAIEKTDFFETVRVHTITGFLANPEYGGNYQRIGWKLIGFETKFYYQPPFGYYDAEAGNKS